MSSSAQHPTSRVKQFRALAEASARGELVMLPRRLSGDDRRLHVRQTLREDHEQRIAGRNEDAEQKFDKLAASLFSFFRRTALVFYRDMAGEDSSMPTVLTLGDVHPENFGVMPNAYNVPIFAVNDFDEAYYAPFTWDLKRGAVGFMIAGEEIAGHGRKRQRKVARHFVDSYLEAIGGFAEQGSEGPRADGSDDLIIELKRARGSALAGLAPPSRYDSEAHGDRIAHAQGVQLARGDIFYGSVEFEGMSFMSRERAPYRGDIDLEDLDKDGWMEYAAICGGAVAHAHALSDESGELDADIEPQILRAASPPGLLVDDVTRFAEEAAERMRRDQQAFRADHELAAFSAIDISYR